MKTTRLLAPLALLVLTSCATTSPTLSSSDIAQARNMGTLLDLYEDVRDSKGSAKGLKPQNKQALLTEIEEIISADLTEKIKDNLKQGVTETHFIPISVLEEQQQLITQHRYASASVKSTLSQTINEHFETTKTHIETLKIQAQPSANISFAERLALFQQIALLSSNAERPGAMQQTEQLVTQVTSQARQLLQDKQILAGFTLLNDIKQLAPNSEGAQYYQTLRTGGLQSKLTDFINSGEAAAAYNTLRVLTDLGELNRNAQLDADLQLLSQYFDGMSAQALADDDLKLAYDALLQSRFISGLINDHLPPSQAEGVFVDTIFSRYQLALRQNQYELALGYLSVIETLRPSFPDLTRLQQQNLEVIRDTAMKKVSVTTFSSFSDRSAVGNTLAAKITEYLFNYLPNDVRVVEREHLDAVMREQEISALNRNTNLNLASADLLIQGSVVEANVETTQSTGRQTQRVVTRYESVPNPAHAEWSKLSRSNRNKTPEPPTHLEEPREEDVSIGITNYRKIAILGVSYRVVDASSATVLFAESLNEREVQADDSREGVQLGVFSLDFKNAELPSDSEMINVLTERLAARVGEQVSDLLKNQEAVFLREAQRLELEQNYLEANKHYARSYAIAASKAISTLSLEERMRSNALRVNL